MAMPIVCARHRVWIMGLLAGCGLAALPLLGHGAEPQKPAPPVQASAEADDFIEGNYWALIIGINKYPNMDKDKQLEAPRKDAEALAKLLIARYGFSKERMIQLYDEAASRKGILRAFNSLKRRLTDKDSLFIYYAGHGEYEESKDKMAKSKRTDETGYWIPSDAEIDDPSSYVFDVQVREYMRFIDARHIYLVVDSAFNPSLLWKTRPPALGSAAKLYGQKSRWVLISGGLYPVADPQKNGHSAFASNFMKMLEKNAQPYLMAKDLAEPLAVMVSTDVKGQVPRSAPLVGVGDEEGQFVFHLKKEFQKGLAEIAAIESERAKLATAGQREIDTLEDQLKKAEDALKVQHEEAAKRKQAMLEKIRLAQEQAARDAVAEEARLTAQLKTAEEKGKKAKEAEEAEAKRQAEEKERQRLADLKRQEEEKRLAEERERVEREKQALLKRQQEDEAKRKVEEERLAALTREAEEQKRKLAEAAKKMEEEKKELAEKQLKAGQAKPAVAIVEATLRPFQAPKAKDPVPVVLIPAGEFVMGSKEGEGQPHENPQRTVYLDAFTIDKYEVTVAQYAAYMKKTGLEPPEFWEKVNPQTDANRPVVGVDWQEAHDYCEYHGKRLPTEAQWEKAARGEDGRKYPWGNEDPNKGDYANFAKGVVFGYDKSLTNVGSFEAGKSPYGVYDMVGNVWEWVLDSYDKDYYQHAPVKNPAGPSGGDYKVVRGGSWAKRPAIARVAGRLYLSPDHSANTIGFRCAGPTQ